MSDSRDEESGEIQAAQQRARRGVREWVRAAGKRTGRGLRKATPYGILAFLTASAVAPIAAHSLGEIGEFEAALNQLGGVGSNYLADVLADTAARMRDDGRDPSTEQWRDEVAEALLARLEASDEQARHLLREVSQVLIAIDGVAEALAESAKGTNELRRDLVAGIAALGTEFADVQQQLLAHGSELRQQTDLTRRSLLVITEVRQRLLALAASPPNNDEDRVVDEKQPSADVPCPFPGLVSFQLEDAEWFCGREALVAELLGRLAEQFDGAGPLVVVGASGAGKSSVLRAGVLPAVAAGGLPAEGSANWPWLVMTPGTHPITELAARTAALAGVPSIAAVRQLRESPTGFGALARQAALAHGSDSTRLLIVVDQFEELFTHCLDPEERAAFVTALTNAAPAVVVLAVRADFYEQCTLMEPLAPLLPGQVVVGPLGSDDLRRVVLEPAVKAGLEVEPGLVELLVADLGARGGKDYEPGSLPLLAHALRATWLRRSGKTLTVDGYRDAGRIAHAVADTAERIYAELDESGRQALQSALLRMVTVVDGGSAVRRRADRHELPPAVLARLVEARLVTIDRETVQISHEALLSAWPRLAEWVEQDRQGLLVRQQLDEAAHYWTQSGQDEGALYRGGRLATARAWAAGRTDLTEAERSYLHASVRAEQRSTRRLRRLTVSLAVLLIIALAAGVVALVARNTADQRRLEAQSRQLAAESLIAAEADPRGAIRLALRAWRTSPTAEARGALLSAQMLEYNGEFNAGFTTYAMDVSPDGGLVAVGGPKGQAKIWNTRTHQPLNVDLAGHTKAIFSTRFSPDGALLATTSLELDGVRMWEMPGGRLVRTLPAFGKVAWRPGSRVLAAGYFADDVLSGEPVLGLWDAETGRRLARLGSPGLIADVEFSPDGSHVALGRYDGTAELWRVGDATLVARLTGHVPTQVSVTFSPLGQLATAAVQDRAVLLWDTATGRRLDQFEQPGNLDYVSGVNFTPDGSRLLLTNAGDITTWDPISRRHIGEFQGQRGVVTEVAVSRDGRTVVAATQEGLTTTWQRATSWLTLHTGAVISLAFDPTGRTVASSDGDRTVRTWDTATGELTSTVQYPAMVTSLRYGRDGTLILAAKDGSLRVTGPAGGEPTVLIVPGRELNHVAVSPDGGLIAAAAALPLLNDENDSAVHVWDARTLEERAVLPIGKSIISGLAFSPDGSRLAAAVTKIEADDRGSRTGAALRVWRVGDFTEELTIPTGSDQVFGIAFSPDGGVLATGGKNRRIQLRDPASGHVVREFGDGHPSTVRDIVFSPDGRTVATGTTDDPVIRLWDVASGALLANLTGHTSAPNDIAFSPDGRVLASGSRDSDVALWNTEPDRAVERVCRILAGASQADLADLGCP